MEVYFDTKFTGLHKNTTLISIGCVTNQGDSFYGECTDYDKSQIDEWTQNNVINKLQLDTNINNTFTRICGTKKEIISSLKRWLSSYGEPIQFISDVSHYDFVLLIDLFGEALNLPSYISPVCHDINQDIAKYFRITERASFDLSRENIVEDLYGRGYIIEVNKHNALYDAMIIGMIARKVCK
jgi:hypothetical protein